MLDPKATVRRKTQISVLTSTGWNFYDLGQLKFTYTKTGAKWAVPGLEFGILYEQETDPRNVLHTGRADDYLFSSSDGQLTIISSKLAKYYV